METSNQSVNVLIELGKDGSYSAYIAEENFEFGCIGEGNSVEEAIRDFESGVNDMRDVYEAQGEDFPKVDFIYNYDVASFLSYYAYAFTLAGLSRITGINQGQLSHYVTGRRKPSRATVERIEQSLHSFAEQLTKLKLA